jgi:hypothetical protein
MLFAGLVIIADEDDDSHSALGKSVVMLSNAGKPVDDSLSINGKPKLAEMDSTTTSERTETNEVIVQIAIVN